MIHVRVRVFSQAVPDQVELELEDGSSLEALLGRLREKVSRENAGVNDNKITFLSNKGNMIVLLNGMFFYALAGWKTILQEGDEVSLIPAMAGG